MKVVVQFSGGKDSQACLIWACRKFGSANVLAVFCDTGWEHEFTYVHVDQCAKFLGVELKVLRNEKVAGMEGLCKRMKWFPDALHRMCTVQLKMWPSIDFILSLDDDVLIIQGIRAAESSARAKLSCSADYFGRYKEVENKSKLYRKRDVLEWCCKHKAIVERPFFGDDAQCVIDYILAAGMKPNPLYMMGCSRVGCFPCIFAKMSDLKIFAKEPAYVDRVRKLENDVNDLRKEKGGVLASFIPSGKIPGRFCKTIGKDAATIDEVVSYVSRKSESDFFDNDEAFSCMSIYHGLCE